MKSKLNKLLIFKYVKTAICALFSLFLFSFSAFAGPKPTPKPLSQESTVIKDDQSVNLMHLIEVEPNANGVIVSYDANLKYVEKNYISDGGSIKFQVRADQGCQWDKVLVDGVPVAVNSNSDFTISNITENHIVTATYKPLGNNIHKINVSDPSSGNIVMDNELIRNIKGDYFKYIIHGNSIGFLMKPATDDYQVKDVLVDGVSIGAKSYFLFSNVIGDHTISATFALKHVISSSVESNGIISPLGKSKVVSGEDKTFTIIPADNYKISDLIVDGKSVGAYSSYTFKNVNENHSIKARFTFNSHIISASANKFGAIYPAGATKVAHGQVQYFTITPASNSKIVDVLVNKISVGPVTSYKFDNVTSDQSITAIFQQDEFNIQAKSNQYGTISLQGSANFTAGSSQTYTFTPQNGYNLESLLVDYIPVKLTPGQTSYTFVNINSNHVIDARFGNNTHPSHNFTYTFDPSVSLPAKFDLINWKSSSGINHRILWDETDRFVSCWQEPGATNCSSRYPVFCNSRNMSCSQYLTFLHSGYFDTNHPNFTQEGWKYRFFDIPNSVFTYAQTDSTKLIKYRYKDNVVPSPNASFVQIEAWSTNEDALHVYDDIFFIGDEIYFVTTLENQNPNHDLEVEVPVKLGSLLIGNFDPIQKILNTADYGMTRLSSKAAGVVEPLINSSQPDDMYPETSRFSPVAALWGKNSFDASGVYSLNGSVTLSGQFLTQVDKPTQIGFNENPKQSNSPVFVSKIHTILTRAIPRKTFVIVFSLKEGDQNWQDGLEIYKNWFNFNFGTFNPQNLNYQPIPQYCPQGPFYYFVGSGRSYNKTTGRYNPGTKIAELYNPKGEQSLNVMRDLNIEHFGNWKQALTADYLVPTEFQHGKAEFSPMITLIDPNLDAAAPPQNQKEVYQKFISSYRKYDINPFLYTVPCHYIENASISYDYANPSNSIFNQGDFVNPVDLSIQANKDRYINDLKTFVDLGYKGFYFDEYSCPGTIGTGGSLSFLEYVKQEFPTLDFLLTEGANDRQSLIAPSVPLLNTYGTYNHNHSLLINYLVPNATYYVGDFNVPFKDADLLEILDKGYEAIPMQDAPQVLTAWDCKLVEQSRVNQRQKWEQYGKDMGCQPPPEMSQACLDKTPFDEHTVLLTSEIKTEPGIPEAHGTFHNTDQTWGDWGYFVEGSHVYFLATPDAGYQLDKIYYENGTDYSWNTTCVSNCDKPYPVEIKVIGNPDSAAKVSVSFKSK